MSPKRQWKRWTTEQAREALERWAASGLPLHAFADQEKVSLAKLMRWKSRLDETDASRAADGQIAQSMVPVRVAARSGRARRESTLTNTTRLSVRLLDGTRVQLSGPDPEELCRAVFRALRRCEGTC